MPTPRLGIVTDGAETLTYAVRPGAIGKYLGQLALMLAALALVPFVASLLFQEYPISLRYVAVIVPLALLGAGASRLSEPAHIQVNESLCIVALAFVLSPLIMLYPMLGAGLPWQDTLFEAVSAVTTTGLSTVGELADKPRSFLLARAWMQWYGGLGIVVLSVALLMGHQMAARRLTEPVSGETLASTARAFARRMLVVYVGLTLLFLFLLWWLIGDGFVALTHTLAAVSTGGFSSFNDSLAGVDGWSARYAIILAGLCGAIPLSLYYQLWQGDWREVLGDAELRALLLFTLLITALLGSLFVFNQGLPWPEALRHALVIGASAQSTAGFTTLPIGEQDNSAKLGLILSMFIGGGVGSTAGGIKVLRLLILFRVLQVFLQRTAMPSHAVAEPQLSGKRIEGDDIQRVMMLMLLFVAVIFLSWFAFIAYG